MLAAAARVSVAPALTGGTRRLDTRVGKVSKKPPKFS